MLDERREVPTCGGGLGGVTYADALTTAETNPQVWCPTTGDEIPRPFPMAPGIAIMDARFDCPACGSEHVISYPPVEIKK